MMARNVIFALLVVLTLSLSGCATEAEESPTPNTMVAPSPHAFVALIDRGINPYHAVFRAVPGKGAESIAEALGAQVLHLSTTGDYAARVEADEATWASIEPGRLYAFAGTRVLAVSISKFVDDPAILDSTGHGTSTASVVALTDPHAFIVMVQADLVQCNLNDPAAQCSGVVPFAPAMEWIADQPWIDVVSVSMNYQGNPPIPSGADPDQAAFLDASRRAHDDGKVILNSAGNYVTPSLMSHLAGPPWLIAVGGSHGAQHGEEPTSGKGADVLANFTLLAANGPTIEGMSWTSGTSFSTPLVAGTLSRAITLVKSSREGPVAPLELRDALNATALPWTPLGWDPLGKPTNDTYENLLARSLPVLTPTQSGWGHVDAMLAPEIARRILEQDFTIPPEKAQTAQYMAEWQSLREAYWQSAP